ncbi:MAG: SDR family oxidoreductase [Candidatus Korarchaeota archaeon]|nr:SDR family oxidoreductase [Candidatus Korarchaeota archaeon]NIU82960.1 SDR family oxidoreductase [Candidatus Thorarchaeota archaeon]NIW13383.1 SDR family oxidoreductase [Candidatus Thorarchaeota archaeon]NIW51483.1 SDR family oxidoreductase [Candidatus Korarchaeota archaeon]
MQQEFAGKRILVTGASGGVGPALTDRLCEKGATVIGTYHSRDNLEKAKERAEHASAVAYYRVDLTEEADVEALKRNVEEDHGTIHGIVNLVGGFSMGKLQETDLKHLKASFDRHATTIFLVLKHFVDHLEANRGSVVNFSSQRAINGNPSTLAYNVGKVAVTSLTKTINRGLKHTRVNAVAPDIIDTPTNRASMSGADRSKWTSLERVSDVVEFLLSERSETITGEIIRI